MSRVKIEWWKATEIPLAETDWKNIRLYSDVQQHVNPFDWERCAYGIRLSPPFAIHYGDEETHLVSPLIYFGSGSIRSRWKHHREWLAELGYAIPGGRYEVWVCRPRVRNSNEAYAYLEGYLLCRFREKTNYLPLRNRKIESGNLNHEYDLGVFEDLIKADRRYLWAIWPQRGLFEDHYYKGAKE